MCKSNEEVAMTEQILVAYASQNGLTKEFARAIADTLSKQGKIVDLRMVNEIDDLSRYTGVVIGSSLRSGHWLPDATAFVTRASNSLRQVPTAYFTVCDM